MSTATIAKPSLTLKRRYNAPPAKVFAAWIDPEKLARWFGPEGVTGVQADVDLRVGGRYDIKARTPTEEHKVGGVYREIVPNEKLVFTWAWQSTPDRQSVVTVVFKPDGDGTLLTLTHEQFFDEDARDRHQHGWTGALDKLTRMFA
jgi:uncharacterized protein YndB with AHSA1/START domain